MQKEAESSNPRLLTVFLLVLLITGCDRHLHDFELDERSFDHETMQEIQTNSHLSLSTNAHGLNFFYKAPIDPAFAAKIEVPSNSEANLLDQLSKVQTQDIHVSGAIGPQSKWWTPEQGKVLIDRQGIQKDGAYLHAVLTEEKGRVILYLESDIQ